MHQTFQKAFIKCCLDRVAGKPSSFNIKDLERYFGMSDIPVTIKNYDAGLSKIIFDFYNKEAESKG